MFTPDMQQIRDWVASGKMSSDLQAAERGALIEGHPETLLAFKRLFATSDGKIVLDYLASASVLRAPVDHTAANYVAYAQLRQGQNQLFSLILELMALGEEGERKQDGHGNDGSASGRRIWPGNSSDGGNAGGDDGDDDTGGWSDFDRAGDIAIP